MGAFMERLGLVSHRCPDCHGTGRDRKKKKRRCPICRGTGYVAWCPKCDKIAYRREDASGTHRIPESDVCQCEG